MNYKANEFILNHITKDIIMNGHKSVKLSKTIIFIKWCQPKKKTHQFVYRK